MLYRDHRGGLEASMETVREVTTIQEIKDHLNSFYNDFGFSVAQVTFKHVGIDTRTNWDTYYVLYCLEGESNFEIAGMSDGFLTE